MSGKEPDKTKSKEVSLSCALALMDNLYSTLVVLQYPMRDPKLYGDSKGELTYLYFISLFFYFLLLSFHIIFILSYIFL